MASKGAILEPEGEPHHEWYDCETMPPRKGQKVRLKIEMEIEAFYAPGEPFSWIVDETTRQVTNLRAWKATNSQDNYFDFKKELDDESTHGESG